MPSYTSVLYVCIPYQLYYDSSLSLYISFCVCINYANEGYLHRAKSIFSVEKCDYNKACPCKFEIVTKYGGYDWHFFQESASALMSNLCKLAIYLHNKLIYFVMIRFPLPIWKVCTKIDINLDWILYIHNFSILHKLGKLGKICIWMKVILVNSLCSFHLNLSRKYWFEWFVDLLSILFDLCINNANEGQFA